MANLGDLKTRIISETLRDDLADDMAAQLTLIIQKSIDHYAAMRWWWNEKAATVPTVIGSPYAALPVGFRFLDAAWLKVGGVAFPLALRQAEEIDNLYTASTAGGQPTDVAILETNLYLWPTAQTVYPVELRYVADATPALDYASDTSANFWTNEGQDIITARAKLRLYRDYLSAQLQDPRVVSANNQEQEAYSRLRSEHNRRLSTNRVRAGW
jgi:hypothetical protein